jgi:hypothetical protein
LQIDASGNVNIDSNTLYVDATNNRVGLGTTTPQKTFAVSSSGAQGIELAPNDAGAGSNRLISYNRSTSAYTDLTIEGLSLQFQTNNGTERARIDSSGRLLVGTSSSSSTTSVVIQGNTAARTGTNSYAFLDLVTGDPSVGGNPYLGLINFMNSAQQSCCRIDGMRDGGTWTNGSSHPTRLVFSTTADGASSPTERARITSNGNLWVGGTAEGSARIASRNTNFTSTNKSANVCFLGASNGNGADGSLQFTDAVANNTWFGQNNGGAYVFCNTNGVRLASGGTSWASDSDERVKDIIEPIENGLSKVASLRAVIGKYKTDEEDKRRSFLIAQDVEAVLPEAVFENQGTLMLAYAETIPLLVAALKESKERIEALEAKVAALEAA